MLRWRWSLALLLAGLTTGCGNVNEAARSVAEVRPVQDVGDLYRMYMLEHKKPPASPSDFLPYQDASPEAVRAVKDGEVLVVWDVALTDLSPEGGKDAADEVLAYEKKVPTEGGTVLMKNRTIRQMTADQFQAAPKARAK